MSTADTESSQLQAGIAALEAQRPILGDAVVDAAIAPIREKLAALQARAQPTQQRKLATVLFADVSGFTALSETLDAEIVAGVMNDLWTLVDRAILDQGGRIDKHIGDAVMAVWGVESAREDDPERAVRAALAVQTGVAASTAGQMALTLRLGINTGPVLLGPVGTTGEYTAMGDTVNLASRLEHAAPAGGVLIAHDTYRHIRGVFDVSIQPPVAVKGKAQPVRNYLVQRAKPRAFRMATRGVEGIETRMIGRDAELLALEGIFHDVAQTPQTRLVTVIGEAGVGKSRLLYEFENWVEVRPERVAYFKGRAMPDQRRQALRLFRDLLSFRFEILDNDGSDVALAKFRRGVAGILEQDEADVLGYWLGFDFSSSQAVARLLGASDLSALGRGYCVRYLRTLAQSRPVMLLFEDIHWADDSSLDLINDLVESLGAAADPLPLLFVCLARPAFFEKRPNWGEGKASFTSIHLSPLSVRAGRELVAEILQRVDHVPEEMRDLIVGNAEGNPFYVEELVKMLIDEQVILREGDQWRIATQRLGAVRVPGTLTGLLQARLDALPGSERDLLQRASVVGRLFWDSAVACLSDVGQDKVSSSLRDIRARERTYLRERSAFSGSDEYIFEHALLRDVAYEMVLLQQRREYHRRVAAWLEENATGRLGEYLGLIAEHYALAGDADRAADFWERAGDHALLVGAGDGALTAFQRVMELAHWDEGGLAQARLQFKLARASIRLGDYRQAETLLARVRDTAVKQGEAELEVRALENLAWCGLRRGDFRAMEAVVTDLISLARKVGGAALARSLNVTGYFHAQKSDYELATTLFEESLALARSAGEVSPTIDALNGLGAMAMYRADLTAAERFFLQCRQLAAEIGDKTWENAANLNLGNVYYERRDFQKARSQYREILDHNRATGNLRDEALTLINLSFAELELKEWPDAERHTGQSLALAYRLNLKPEMAYAILLTGKRKAMQGEPERALALYGVVLAFESTAYDARRDLALELDALTMGADEKAAGLAAGAALDFETVVQEILAGQW